MRSTLVWRNSWGFAFAELADDVAALLLAAPGGGEHRQAGQQQATAADWRGGAG